MWTITEADRVHDRNGILALDTAFDTDQIFDLVVGKHDIALARRVLPRPLTKRFPIADAFADWATWQFGFVARDEKICGFAAAEYEAWHKRVVLWHLYVDASYRRRGIARALLRRIESHSRALGAKRVWLETSNVNVPGIEAYRRLGYALVGADVTHYEGTNAEGESAIFLSRALE